MTRSGLQNLPNEREVHSDVREVLPDVWEWLEGPSRMSGSGGEAIPDDREWSGGFPE